MLIKEESYQNNLEKSYTERKTKHERSGYSLSLTCSFDATKNRHYLYRGKDWAENFCKRSKELGTEIINYEEKEMIHKQIKKIKFCKRQKVCHICKNKIKKKKFLQMKIMKMNLNKKKGPRSLLLHRKI